MVGVVDRDLHHGSDSTDSDHFRKSRQEENIHDHHLVVDHRLRIEVDWLQPGISLPVVAVMPFRRIRDWIVVHSNGIHDR